MPLMYRAMLPDGSKPQVGPRATTLGVRTVPDETPDLPVDDGAVRPGTGGMSVAPAWQKLPAHRIPRRLAHMAPGAKGNNSLRCWRIGEGPFEAGRVAPCLALRPDPERPEEHGFVEPHEVMSFERYNEAL